MAWLKWAISRVGYMVRPYDMLADRRRWFWQDRQRCGWPGLCPCGKSAADCAACDECPRTTGSNRTDPS